MRKVLINRFLKILHSDIEPLEVFQSALLIFVNPINLMHIQYNDPSKMYYIYTFCLSCLIVGVLSIIAIVLNNLRFRLQVARVHWVITLTIASYILNCDVLRTDISLFLYYVVQCISCFFVITRLFLEYKKNNKE